MDDRQIDAISTTLARGLGRRQVIASILGAMGLVKGRSETVFAAARKPVGAKCQQHSQCASGLCEATAGTCVAQCAVVGGPCGVGGICQPVGAGGAGNACVVLPSDLNCARYTPCTWNVRATTSAEQLSCPKQPGAICLVTGLCSGPEEVCVPLSPPA